MRTPPRKNRYSKVLLNPALIIGGLFLTAGIGAVWLAILWMQPHAAAVAEVAITPDSLSAPPITTATPSPTVRIRRPRPTRTPTSPAPTAAPRPTATLAPTVPASIPPTPFPSRPFESAGIDINVVEHFILGRPVAPDAESNRPDWYYLYGTTEQGSLAVHHGVEFVNPIGTPLLAVADGAVVVAGADDTPKCGAEQNVTCGETTDYYGNLVVLQLDITYLDQPVYVLYGHMDTVAVHAGDRVQVGQTVGTVGMTGVALGPHVHFEVRVGVNDYAHTQDPLLWLVPLSGEGMLAGMVIDAAGNQVVGATIDLLDGSGKELEFSETYGRDDAPSVNEDDNMHENFTLGDLSAGQYQVRVVWNGNAYTQPVKIEEGHLAFVVVRTS